MILKNEQVIHWLNSFNHGYTYSNSKLGQVKIRNCQRDNKKKTSEIQDNINSFIVIAIIKFSFDSLHVIKNTYPTYTTF